jgi:hypothetical protein
VSQQKFKDRASRTEQRRRKGVRKVVRKMARKIAAKRLLGAESVRDGFGVPLHPAPLIRPLPKVGSPERLLRVLILRIGLDATEAIVSELRNQAVRGSRPLAKHVSGFKPLDVIDREFEDLD